MLTPRIEIDLEKITHNAKALKDLYGSRGIDVIGVTKVVCGNPNIAKALVKSGIHTLGDSRIENIRRMLGPNFISVTSCSVRKIVVRLPSYVMGTKTPLASFIQSPLIGFLLAQCAIKQLFISSAHLSAIFLPVG